MTRKYLLSLTLSVNLIFTCSLAEANESYEAKLNTPTINAFVFKKTLSVKETLKTKTTPMYNNLFIDFNGNEYSLEGVSKEIGIGLEKDSWSYTLSSGKRILSSNLNYKLTGDDKTLVSSGVVHSRTALTSNYNTLGIQKTEVYDKSISSSLGLSITKFQGFQRTTAKIDFGLLKSNETKSIKMKNNMLTVSQKLSVRIAGPLFFDLGLDRSRTISNGSFSSIASGEFFGLTFKPFNQHTNSNGNVPKFRRKNLLSFDLGNSNAVASGKFDNTPGDYSATTKYRAVLPMEGKNYKVTYHRQFGGNKAIRFSIEKRKNSGELSTSKLALAALGSGFYQTTGKINLEETRVNIEHEKVFGFNGQSDTYGFIGVFAGITNFQLEEQEILPSITRVKRSKTRIPLGGISIGIGQRYWINEQRFFAIENKLNYYDGGPFGVPHQINEYCTEFKLGWAF
ncbi:hypothetical protein N9M78_06335 [Alphaproteobacteria bacterium]|nr:hypothetical protein [Alphaproteobacteria bacterium]